MFGTYVAEESNGAGATQRVYPVSRRFREDAISTGALRLVSEVNVPLYFARLFGISSSRVTASASVARSEASIPLAIGSGLVAFSSADSPLLNAFLGSMLGTSVDLDLVHYRGLAAARIDAARLVGVAGSENQVAAGQYDRVLSSDMSLGRLFGLTADMIAQDQAAARVDQLRLCHCRSPQPRRYVERRTVGAPRRFPRGRHGARRRCRPQ